MDVTVYGPLRSATGEKHVAVDFAGGTVREALDAFVTQYPRAEQHLFDDGSLEASVRITVNGDSVEPEDPCPADAALSIHPAIRGG